MSLNHCQQFPPTVRQLEALWHVQQHQRARGYGISVRALCEALGIRSTNAGADFIRALCRKGLAAKDEMVARSLRVTPQGARFLLGFVPAGHDARSREESTGNTGHEVKSDTAALNTGEGA